jgi:hypothetical protein
MGPLGPKPCRADDPRASAGKNASAPTYDRLCGGPRLRDTSASSSTLGHAEQVHQSPVSDQGPISDPGSFVGACRRPACPTAQSSRNSLRLTSTAVTVPGSPTGISEPGQPRAERADSMCAKVDLQRPSSGETRMLKTGRLSGSVRSWTR